MDTELLIKTPGRAGRTTMFLVMIVSALSAPPGVVAQDDSILWTYDAGG